MVCLFYDSTTFNVTVTSVNDLPIAFEWVSSTLDTIYISQSNLNENYTLEWEPSKDPIDGDSINYLLYAKIGAYPAEEIYDTTSTSISISYQEILDGAADSVICCEHPHVFTFGKSADKNNLLIDANFLKKINAKTQQIEIFINLLY